MKKIVRFFLLTLFMSIMVFPSIAQENYVVRFMGTVTFLNNYPMENAEVRLLINDSLIVDTLTDPTGNYLIEHTLDGSFTDWVTLEVIGLCGQVESIDTMVSFSENNFNVDFSFCEYSDIQSCEPVVYYEVLDNGGPTKGEVEVAFFFADTNLNHLFSQVNINFGDNTGMQEFDDGMVHIYSQEDIYEVWLRAAVASGGNCSGDTTFYYLNVYAFNYPDTMTCLAAFSYDFNPDDHTVSFFNFSEPVDNIMSYHWFLGDGQESNEFEPVHRYIGTGEFWVRLEVLTQEGNYCSVEQPVWVYEDEDSLWFDTDTCSALFYTDYIDSMTVDFNDISWAGHSMISAYYWDFGDGNYSIEPNPRHTYSDTGEYLISLTIQTTGGCQSSFEEFVYIGRQDTTGYALFYPKYGGGKGYTVKFHNLSKGDGTWVWQFGDSKSDFKGSGDIVSHLYKDTGFYTVRLIDSIPNKPVYAMDINVMADGMEVIRGYALRSEDGSAPSITKYESSNFDFYPNPVDDVLNIRATEYFNPIRVSVYTTDGKMIYTDVFSDQIVMINTSNWDKGVYIIRITDGKQNTSFKVVK